MELKNEMRDIGQKLWTKLQELPQANGLEVAAFVVLILFVATILLMVVLCCVHCCLCGRPKTRASRVQPGTGI